MMEVHCSSLTRLELCPGSLLAGGDIQTPDTDLTLSGRVIHNALKVWANGIEPDQTRMEEREVMVYHWFRSEVEKIEAAHGGMGLRLAEYSVRIEFGDVAVVGTLDLLVIPTDGTVHLIDYKTGYAEQTPAPANRQLMGYAVGIHEERPSWVPLDAYIFSAGDDKEHRFTRTAYTEEATAEAKAFLEKIARAAVAPDAARSPGEHCQYCPALGTERCPETAKDILDTRDVLIKRPVVEVLPAPARCREIYDAIKAVDRYANAFLPVLKMAVESDPKAWEGVFTLKEGANVRSFVSTEQACDRLISDGVPPNAIWRAINLSPAKAETLLKAHRPMKGKAAADYFQRLFEDIIVTKQNAPSLKKAK